MPQQHLDVRRSARTIARLPSIEHDAGATHDHASHPRAYAAVVRRVSPAEFVLAHTRVRPAPFVPELRLHLADPDQPTTKVEIRLP